MKQILINYISILHEPKNDRNYYVFELPGDKNNGYTFDGYQTNEPVLRYCAISSEDGEDTFDHMISVRTDRVGNDYCLIDEEKIIINTDLDEYCERDDDGEYVTENKIVEGAPKTYHKINHYKYFENKLNKICNEFAISPPSVHLKRMSDHPSDSEIRDMIVEVGNLASELTADKYEDYRLVLDCTGGDRSSAVMIIALTKMLENKGFKEIKLLGVNFFPESTPEERCPVRYKTEMSGTFDLITGTRMFLDYGDAKGLQSFFETINLGNSDLMILKTIQEFSDSIKLCIPNGITVNLGRMVNQIEKRQPDKEADNTLFNYLLAEIWSDFGILTENSKRTDINIIKWCLRKGLIQQAVTLYAERIPKVFIEQGFIYYPMGINWDEVAREFVNADEDTVKVYRNNLHNKLAYDSHEKIGTPKEMQVKKSPYDIENNFIDRCIRYSMLRNFQETAEVKIGDRCKNSNEKCRELATNIRNYKIFKRKVRNNLNHAGITATTMKGLEIHRLKLIDTSIAEEKISPDAICRLMDDLIKQLEKLGMR